MVAAGMAAVASAQKVGEPAPDFRAPSTADREITLADFRGRWLVLFFYPRAFTPGCTRQACSLRDGYERLADLKADVLGVSLDPIERLKEFKKTQALPYELLSDHEKRISTAYGVLGPLGAYAERRTFLIAPDGTIAAIIDRVDVDAHAAQVREALKQRQAAPN
jgi:peroxiredoxin Q/BCP